MTKGPLESLPVAGNDTPKAATDVDGATVVVVEDGVLSIDVIVNASNPPASVRNRPAAVQFPADPHDTALK